MGTITAAASAPLENLSHNMQVCVGKFMSFHDRQYNLGNAGGTDGEANCTMSYGMLSARCAPLLIRPS